MCPYTVCVRSSAHPPRSHCQQKAAGSSHGAPPSQSATHCHSAYALRTESPVLYLQRDRAKVTHRCKLPVLSIQHSLPHRPGALTHTHTHKYKHVLRVNWQDISPNSNVSIECRQAYWHSQAHKQTHWFTFHTTTRPHKTYAPRRSLRRTVTRTYAVLLILSVSLCRVFIMYSLQYQYWNAGQYR